MKFKIRGKMWQFLRPKRLHNNDLGSCDRPDVKNKAIKVKSSVKGELELDVILHELLHAAFWDLTEEAVDQTASDIARALWKLGYRKTDGNI